MVKFFLLFTLILLTLHAEENFENNTSVQTIEDPLMKKVSSLLEPAFFEENRDFINVIFDPKSSYYDSSRVDVIKVIGTLKENGLLKLFFQKPQEITLNFKTNGSPLFFVKLMENSLRNIGYYRYVTTASKRDDSEFLWSIKLTSEYATDPLVLNTELEKSGCKIIDVSRQSATEWSYVIDMHKGYLNLKKLTPDSKIVLKRSLYAHWLNVENVKTLHIQSSKKNTWYPHIAYYDTSMHLLKVIKSNEKSFNMTLTFPKECKYIKISDLYTLKNLKDGLILYPKEQR